MRKNSWPLLFQFLVLWLLTSMLSYAILVLPFYPEVLYKSRENFELKSANDYFFLILTELANSIGVVISFWYMKCKIEKISIKQLTEFNTYLFSKGIIVGLSVILSCSLLLFFFKLITFSFFNINNVIIQILFFLMVAISEEIFFRGFILTNFQKSMSLRLAVLLSSIIFALVHIPNPHFGWIGFVNIFLSGILMSILYLRSGNLSAPIGMHFSWNLLQNLFGFAVSGQTLKGLLSVEYHSNEIILTGGKFGLEGSLLLIPITTALIILLWKRKNF